MKPFFRVLVYLVLLPVTWPESPACNIIYSSISSNFKNKLINVTNVLFDDYEVEILSNLEQGDYCSKLWRAHNVYMPLNDSQKKAGSELKMRIKYLLTEFGFFNNCKLVIPDSEPCTKHRRPLVQVLEEFDHQEMETIDPDYSNCTFIRCVSSEPPNKTALGQDKMERTRLFLILWVPVILLFISVMIWSQRHRAEDHRMGGDLGGTSEDQREPENTV